MPSVSVVIPALNEARNLPHVLPHIPPDVHEVILVDGASSDGTIETALRLLPSVRVVLEPTHGKGAALWTGFRAATGDIIVALDADGSTDPREIPAFVSALVEGADFAKGSRFLPPGGTSDMSRLRSAGNHGLVLLVRLLFGAPWTDLCYGYNAFWRSVLPQLESDCRGFEVETAMNLRAASAGLRIAEVPSFESRRIHGTSNLHTFRDGWAVLKTILRERFAPSRARRSLPGAAGIRAHLAAASQPIVITATAAPTVRQQPSPAAPGALAATVFAYSLVDTTSGAIAIEPDPMPPEYAAGRSMMAAAPPDLADDAAGLPFASRPPAAPRTSPTAQG